MIVLIMGGNFFSKHNTMVLKVPKVFQNPLRDFVKKFPSSMKGVKFLNKRRRDIQVKFYVDEKELEQINRRVHLANVTNRGAYLRKMAIDGFLVNVDTSDLRAVVKEMNAIGKNINQITRNANTYGIMKQDVETIKTKVDEIWQLLKSILSGVLSASQ